MDGGVQSQIMSSAVESGKAMGSAMKQDSKDEGMAELYKLNQVWYRMPPTLSLVSKRTITRCNFQQTSYAAPLNQQIATAIFNTGEFQVNGKTSYLVIRVGINKDNLDFWAANADAAALQKATVKAFFGQGGVLNLIEEVTFLSASGTEVDRQQNKGLQASHVARNRMSQDWYNTAGELQGYPGGAFEDCYDKLGHPGYVQDDAKGTLSSPYIIPTRGIHKYDPSQIYLDGINVTPNTNAATITSAAAIGVNPIYNQTAKPYGGASYTGSVDISYSATAQTPYNVLPGQSLEFIVPLCELLGMFCPYMDALIPSQALAGGRVEIRFKDPTEALIATGAGIGGVGTPFVTATNTTNANAFLRAVTVDDIYFLLDSFQLNEGTLRRLNEAAAGNEGLSVLFDTWDNTQTTVSGTVFEAQVSQARSRILRSFCVLRDSLARTNPFANSLASEAAINRPYAYRKSYTLQQGSNLPILVNKYQAVLGSLYFPQQPLASLEEQVMNSYYTFSRNYGTGDYNSVSVSEFMGGNGVNIWDGAGAIIAPMAESQLGVVTDVNRAAEVSAPSWAINWGSATYGFLAERSQLLQLSGLPISNARLLRHQFTVNYAPASGSNQRLVDVFTEYTRVMKVFLGGRIVMRE